MAFTVAPEHQAGFEHVLQSPADRGTLELIVRRPAVDEREILEEGVLDRAEGLMGDTWSQRPSSRTPDGTAHPDKQITVINARLIALLAGDDPDRRALAGDQLHVDLDLSEANLPAWTMLRVGEAVIQVTDQPHTGCAKFTERFGLAATRLISSPGGRALRLRGLNAKVVEPGAIRRGDLVTKL